MHSVQFDLKPFVTLRKTTDGLISRLEILLGSGTRLSVMKTANLVRQPLNCFCRVLPAGCVAGMRNSFSRLRSAFPAYWIKVLYASSSRRMPTGSARRR